MHEETDGWRYSTHRWEREGKIGGTVLRIKPSKKHRKYTDIDLARERCRQTEEYFYAKTQETVVIVSSDNASISYKY